jgi:hypothetical protein
MRNRYGLSRNIEERVKREVRRNCSFGCVICGSGFYQYEHITPEFKDAKEHDPNKIACLCASHHDQVTRGTLSKATVARAYEEIKTKVASGLFRNPVGPLDLNVQWPSIQIGRLHYAEGLSCLLRYMGTNIIHFEKGTPGEPARIYADIHDSDGEMLFKIHGNEWIGPADRYDFKTEGKSLKVWGKRGNIILDMELEPPGKINIKTLDMRVGNAHIIATDRSYVLGRLCSSGTWLWAHAYMEIIRSSPLGTAFDFTTDQDLEMRDRHLGNNSQEMRTEDGQVVINAFNGILIKPLGIAIGALTGSHQLVEFAVGTGSIEEVREVVKRIPDKICQFISTGTAD